MKGTERLTQTIISESLVFATWWRGPCYFKSNYQIYQISSFEKSNYHVIRLKRYKDQKLKRRSCFKRFIFDVCGCIIQLETIFVVCKSFILYFGKPWSPLFFCDSNQKFLYQLLTYFGIVILLFILFYRRLELTFLYLLRYVYKLYTKIMNHIVIIHCYIQITQLCWTPGSKPCCIIYLGVDLVIFYTCRVDLIILYTQEQTQLYCIPAEQT